MNLIRLTLFLFVLAIVLSCKLGFYRESPEFEKVFTWPTELAEPYFGEEKMLENPLVMEDEITNSVMLSPLGSAVLYGGFFLLFLVVFRPRSS